MSSSPKPSSKPASASSSHSSRLSDEDSPSKRTSSAVLFRGPPIATFPSVAQRIASQLALSPPSPFKVLDGAHIDKPGAYPDPFYGWPPFKYSLALEDLTVTTNEGYHRNEYSVSVVARGVKVPCYYSVDGSYWYTIEIPRVQFPSPPSQMLSLFDGLTVFIKDDVGEYKMELLNIFEIFGGRVIETLVAPPEPIVTHYVYVDFSYMTRKEYLRAHCGLASDGVGVHPSWITSSIENGFLLSTSLFSLDPSNPAFQTIARTKGQGGVSAFFSNGRYFLSTPLCFFFSDPPSLPEPALRACLEGRRVFFDLDESQHLQLVQALSSVVSRMGAEVVSHVSKCDWVVTSKRSGAAYLYGLQHPEIIMGFLHHLLENIKNLLYYPKPTGQAHWLSKSYISIFISRRHPDEYRRYLSELCHLMTGRFPLLSGLDPLTNSILIAPCCTPFDEDEILHFENYTGRILLPKFLEQSFLNFKTRDTFNLTTKTFRKSSYECFAPAKLPKNFGSIEFRPCRIPVEFAEKWSDLETRWELHEKVEHHRSTCQCNVCAYFDR